MLKSPASDKAAAIRRALGRWYRQNARSLPWRETQDPYAIWVSEVMLQQTQVATVIPYYRRFLRVFPTVQRLAQASLERVLKIWSGLGYYRRARHLHQAARLLVDKYAGKVSQDYSKLRKLPGIGDYTARAILSIAFNQPYAVLDGNVARVVARLLARRGHLHQPVFRRAIERFLAASLEQRAAGDFNQALMELGQTICLPRAPRCPLCPLRKCCRACKLEEQEAYPAPRPRRRPESVYLAAAIIRCRSRVALVRGLDHQLLGDLWNFPAAFGASPTEARCRLENKLAAMMGGSIQLGDSFGEVNHGITHRSIRVNLYPANPKGSCAGDSLRWFPADRLNKSAVSQLTRKIAKAIL